MSPEAMEMFCQYDWPGNVRELDNAVRRCAAVRTSDLIRVNDLPHALRNFTLLRGKTEYCSEEITPLAEVERRHMLHAVDHTRGDVTAAAIMLGVGRTTLYRKLKSYGSKRLESGEAAPRPDKVKNAGGDRWGLQRLGNDGIDSFVRRVSAENTQNSA